MTRRILGALLLVCLWAGAALAGARLEVPPQVGLGEPFLVRIVSDRPFRDVTVYWLEREVRPTVKAGDGGNAAEILLGTDVLEDEPGMREISAVLLDGSETATLRGTVEVRPKDYPVQALTLPSKMVTPPKEELARIARERELNHRILDQASLRRFWALPLVRPVSGPVESVYGAARVLNGQKKNPHRGLDFDAAKGQPVLACATGTVVLVADQYYAGKCVIVDHGNGVQSLYYHLSEAKVREGYRVDRGEVLGLVGSTGRATGPHLHFALSVQGRLVDPLPLLEE